MRIKIDGEAVCKDIPIPEGEYWVALLAGSSQIRLMRGGKDIMIPATRRRSRSREKKEVVRYYCGGGKLWSLEVCSPRGGDWVAFIEYV